MKILFASLSLGLGLASSLFAAAPLYSSLTGAGTTGLIFPAQPGNQIRIVSANWQSDSNTAALTFTSGQGAYSVTVTNAASTSTTNSINSTNGLVASSVLVLEHAGTDYPATLSSFSSNATWGCFVVVGAGGFGVSSSVGDSVYQMGNSVSVPIGATTNWQNGEALYVASLPGRPVRAGLSPAASTNRLTLTARYE